MLEVGPGLKNVLGYLPGHPRRKVRRYGAYEPNDLFASRLEGWLCSTSRTMSPLACLESPLDIHRNPFVADSDTSSTGMNDSADKFDVILFCHTLYGMKHKCRFIKRALYRAAEGRTSDGFPSR